MVVRASNIRDGASEALMKPKVLALLLVMAFLGGLVAYIISVVRQAEPATARPPPPPLSAWDGELITLDRVAIDSAYRAQIALLFTTWMKDPQLGPARAMVGANHARQAYIDVREALDRRQAEFNAKFGYVEKQCK